MMDSNKWLFIFAAIIMSSMLLSDAYRRTVEIETVGKIVESCYQSGTKNCHALWHKEIG